MKKAKYYYELAAIGGDANARYCLGLLEKQAGNMDRAQKHWMIAVDGGSKKSLENIRASYSDGHATKDDYTKHYVIVKYTLRRLEVIKGIKLLHSVMTLYGHIKHI